VRPPLNKFHFIRLYLVLGLQGAEEVVKATRSPIGSAIHRLLQFTV